MVVTDGSVDGHTSEEVMLAYATSAQPTEQQCEAAEESEELQIHVEKSQDQNIDTIEGYDVLRFPSFKNLKHLIK